MKSRIDNNSFGGTFTDEWLSSNANFKVNGKLVSEWILTNVLPDSSFRKPVWDGSDWIEGWTQADTDAELDALIPLKISKLNFKIGLLTNHGITNDMVQAFFDTLTDPIQKAKLELLWFESSFFERNDPNLVNFAPYLGLNEQDLKNIFINFDGY